MDLRVYPSLKTPWRRVELADTLATTPFPFPGHIFPVDYARALGGFRESSQFCGDWEMWSNLTARYGAAQTRVTVAFNRGHSGTERGCTKIGLNGRLRPLVFVQQKRVLRMLRQAGAKADFDRSEFLRKAPMSVDYLIKHGAHLPARILRYNVGLLLRSTPPSAQYAIFQAVTRVLGVPICQSYVPAWPLAYRAELTASQIKGGRGSTGLSRSRGAERLKTGGARVAGRKRLSVTGC